MNQGKREPDLSTNVPHGAGNEGCQDVEREQNGRENISIEGGARGQEGSMERAREHGEMAGEHAGRAVQETGAAASELGNAGREAFQAGKETIKEAGREAYEAGKQTIQSGKETIKEAGQKARETVSEVVEAGRDALSTGKIESAREHVGSAGEHASTAVKEAGAAASEVGNAGRDVVQAGKQTIKEVGQKAREKVGQVVEAGREALNAGKQAVLGEEGPKTTPTGEAPRAPTMETMGKPPTKTTSINELNDLLRAELASVETYDLALRSVRDSDLMNALRQIRDSHERRVNLLREKIRDLGGLPAASSGVWGAFARLVQRGADLLGNRTALAALEEGEDLGKKRYARELVDLDDELKQFILKELAPEQQKTHDLARSLQKFVKAA